jgi:hypothetical protein
VTWIFFRAGTQLAIPRVPNVRPGVRRRVESDFVNEFQFQTLASLKGAFVKHVAQVISELRWYIAGSESRAELEETDSLLAVALEDLRRKIAHKYEDVPPAQGSWSL